MDNFLEVKIPFRRLAGILRDDFARSVAEEALRLYFQEGDSEAKSALKVAIREHITVPGFRRGKSHLAPAPLLRQAVVEEWQLHEDMVRAVFRLWLETRKDLAGQVGAALREGGLPTEGMAGDTLTGYWKWEEFQAWVDRIREMLPEEDEDEIRLSIALLTGRLPVSDQAYETIAKISLGEEEMALNFWTRILQEMRNLPAEAPEWETLEEFLEEARAIGEEKRRERWLQDQRIALQQAVETFCAKREERIRFFQMERCADWSAEACVPERVEEALRTLQELETRMDQYEDLYNLRPATVAERREWQRQLDVLEEQVLTLYAQLNEYLTVQEEMLPPVSPLPEEGAAVAVEEKREEVPAVERVPEVEEEVAEEVSAVPEVEEEVAEEVSAIPEVEEERMEELPPGVEEAAVFEAEGVPEGIPPAPEVPEGIPPVLEVPEEVPPSRVEEETGIGAERITPAAVEVVVPPAEEIPAEKEANRLLVSLLGENDVLTGYWLAWAMEYCGLKPVIRSSLIGAVQGAFWAMRLWPDRPSRMMNDLRDIAQHTPEGLSRAEQWVAAAAALYLALVAPTDGWGDWLVTPMDKIPALAELAETVRRFASLGWVLQPEDMESVRGREEREGEIRRIAEDARRWLESAPRRSTTYQRASAVWRRMTSPPDGDLYQWFVIVARDQRKHEDQVRQALEDWRRDNWVDDRIQEIDLELVGRRLSSIEGTARRQIIRWAGEACEQAERWLQAIWHERQVAQQREWLQEQLRLLLRSFNQSLPLIDEQIRDALRSLPEGEERAAMHLLGQSVLLLKRVFSLPGGTDTPVEFRFDLPSSIFRERSFQQNLAYRLLWLPEASVMDMSGRGEILFREQYAGTLVRVLLDSSLRERSPEEVLRQWLNLRDYRFIDEFLALVPIPDEARRILEAQSREALRSDLSALHTERRESIVAVEQALIDGLISEGERTSYIGRIEAVGKDLNRVEYHLEANRWLLNLGSLSERLQNVRKELDEKRRNRLEGQRQRWVDLRTRLAGAVPATDFRAIQQKLESALERGEIRVVDEYLASLEKALKGKELPIGLFAPGGKRDRLREFRDAIHPLSEFLNSYSVEKIIRDVVQGKPPAELDLPRLPASRMREIARALFAWSSLKANRSEEHQTDHVIALMEYLGFRTQRSSPVALIQTPGVRQSGLRHWRVRAVPGGTNLVPVPQFGSEREGQYDVIGIWDRPGFNLMSALVDQTVDRPTIVFYFGRLLLRQREDLLHSEELRSLKVPVLILDEILLLFLAREYDIRLGTFFACTLPFTFLNPYVPFAAGAVPPEMFVGRREMVQQLLDPRGPAIVYGGRQLGKSALLRQVWREFHNPGMGKYAILEDIKSLGGPLTGLDYERAFWERVAHRLDVEGFLDVPPNISPKTLQDRIQRRIAEQNLRLMLLLDEADNFLEADAERGFPVVSDLKRLMDGTERRFKVVFAGLHNVQRFQRIPNQPLAHLGTPIEVGPLEPEAAWELLERPLQALGYRFGEGLKEEDPSIPFLIFSYTNYHPGLIQLFGWELVRRLKATRRSGLPPFGISRSDVEAVYRNEEVRKNIRERFTWTLSLDERYEAIALAMILDQWEDRNGFDRFYNHREIQDLVSVFWRDGFEGMESDQFQGYLSEMCGLGVLIQEGGRYRLRSPNVVQLLGTYESLWDRLIEISKKPAPSRLRLESHHALLGESAYSPLSYAQESALKMSRTGVGMVFGSDALGIGHLKEATRRFVEHRQHWEEIRIQPRSGDALVRWLSGQLKYERPSALRVFFRDLDASLWTPEELEEQIQAAVKFASGRSMLRIIFSLGPLTAWRWFQLPSDRREGIEEKAGTIVSIRPLDLLGIQQRLEQHKPELIATERNCRRIREVTGGWPFLVEELLRRCRAERTDDPMPVLDRFEEDLSDPNCDVRRKFIERLQIPSDTPFRVVQAFLREQSVNGGEEYWVPRDLAHMLLEDENPERVSAAIDYLVRMAVLRERLGESKARLKKPEKEVSLDPIIYRLWTV